MLVACAWGGGDPPPGTAQGLPWASRRADLTGRPNSRSMFLAKTLTKCVGTCGMSRSTGPFLLRLPKIDVIVMPSPPPARPSRGSRLTCGRLRTAADPANVTARCPDVVVSPLQRRQPGPPATVEARCRAAPRPPSGPSPCWPSPPSPVSRSPQPRAPPRPCSRSRLPGRGRPRHGGHLLRLEVHRPRGQERPRASHRPAPSTPTSTSPTRPAARPRVPAILTTNGFGGSKADQAGLGAAFAKRGYAVLSYTGLGFPDSGCKISLDDPGVDGKCRHVAGDLPRRRRLRGIHLVAGGWTRTARPGTLGRRLHGPRQRRRRTTRASG